MRWLPPCNCRLFRQLIPGAERDYASYLGRTEYLGIVCPLLVLDRPYPATGP